ncbi:MAG: radical SAM protein, partial [Alphaproteobacteria bacterium]
NTRQSQTSRTFKQALNDYLSPYFKFDYTQKRADIIDRNYLKVQSFTAQRSVTPFVFNNCKQACRFCYVDRGLSAIRYPHNWCRKLEDIDNVLQDFDASTGMSHPIMRFAMMDWEPTEHPQFFEILQHIAKTAPNQQIPIITHGGALTEELLRKIADNETLKKNVLFQVSLNSANVFYRSKLMPGAKPIEHKTAIKSIELMDKLGIKFDVSLVAATNIIPMEDIINTIRYVDNFTPHSYIRVALPTATKHHNPQLLRNKEELCEIDNIITALRPSVKAPIITTVALENRHGLNAIVEEVVPNSAADLCGINSGDEILTIDNIPVRSRTEANILLSKAWYQKANNLPITLKRGRNLIYTVNLGQNIGKNDPRMAGERAVGLFGMLIHDDVDYG